MNPELRRNLWLELPPKRVVALVLILGLVVLVVLPGPGARAGGDAVVYIVALVLAVGYGPHLAARAVIGEVVHRTWDAQRASALSPWQMAIGKILGGTSFAWCGVAICLAAALIATHGDRLVAWAELVVFGATMQAIAYLAAMATIRRGMRFGRLDGFAIPSLALIAGWAFLEAGAASDLRWWGLAVRGPVAVGVLVVFAVWAFVGAWQITAAALQVPPAVWAWPLFLLWLMAWAAGHVDGGHGDAGAFAARLLGFGPPVFDRLWSRLGAAFLVLVPATYLALAIDPRSIVAWRRLGARARARDHAAVLRELPAWVQSVALMAVLAVLLAALAGAWSPSANVARIDPRFLAMLVVGFVLRDIAIFHLTAFGRLPGQGLAATAVYLVVLYGLLPMLAVQFAPGPRSLAFFLPVLVDGGIDAVASIGVVAQAAAAWVWALTALRRPG